MKCRSPGAFSSMGHDYEQYSEPEAKATTGETESGFNFAAVCETCGWENRRVLRDSAVRSKDGHVRENPDHNVEIDGLEG